MKLEIDKYLVYLHGLKLDKLESKKPVLELHCLVQKMVHLTVSQRGLLLN